MLSRIKLSLPDIRTALLAIDDRLTTDQLRAISKQLPTSEEITRIKDFEEVGKLAKADQYFSQIMTLPRLSERLECMIFRRKLEYEIEEIRPDLYIVRNASRELQNASRFRRVLRTVLAVGNALNGSTFRGNALGFRLDALLKLKETKTAKGGTDCPTLLHYIAKVLLRSEPLLITFTEDLPHLEGAARVSVSTVFQSVQALVNGLKTVQTEIDQLSQAPLPHGDHFLQVMQPFVKEAESSVTALNHMMDSLDSELKSLLAFYGEVSEGPEASKPEDFFGLILSFSSSLQAAALEVHDKEAKSAPRTPTIAITEQSATSTDTTIKGKNMSQEESTLKPPPDPYTRLAGGSTGRGDLDQAIRSMRKGTRKDRRTPANRVFLDGGRNSRVFD
ncbi:hypothetical protein QCA50_000033 [Cerrena zonata]|uniref:FH2 domain-containing protein n=1 Tax=Cerrena zonata TaxID=2478898 RepID=A0AAW0GY91_9APHY